MRQGAKSLSARIETGQRESKHGSIYVRLIGMDCFVGDYR